MTRRKPRWLQSAHALCFGDADGKVPTRIRPEQLLMLRWRADDRADDLWTTLNVIQWNVMRGGLSARASLRPTMDQHGRWRRGRRVTTRAVGNINQGCVKLNRALWALGARMASCSYWPLRSARVLHAT